MKGRTGRSCARVSRKGRDRSWGKALFSGDEDVLGRKELFRDALLSTPDRQRLFEAFLSVCEWVHVYYGWRPNLRDEAFNHLLELAIAGGASAIVTSNVKDFHDSDLRFPQVRVVTPKEFLKEMP